MPSVTQVRQRRAAQARRHSSLERRKAEGAEAAATRVACHEVLAFLLAPAAVFVALGAAIIAVVGPAEKWETRLWVIAVLVGLPAGFALARRQQRAGAVTPLGVATSACALLAGVLIRYGGHGTTGPHVVLVVAGVVAALAPFAVARWVPPGIARSVFWTGLALAAVAGLVLPFLPHSVSTGHVLVIALPLAVAAFAALRYAPAVRVPAPGRTALEVVFGVAVFLLAFRTTTVPEVIHAEGIYNHDFLLGPVNAMMHGRPGLVDTWSQYGIGELYGLRAVFWVLPFGYGGFMLLEAFLTGLLYVVFYVVVRGATQRPVLAAVGVLVAISRQVFNAAYGWYLDVPSTGPLRFGAPYVLIGLAVLAARRPGWARPLRALMLVTIALAAMWSFESMTYTLGAAAAIAVVEALAADDRRLRRAVTSVATAVGAALAGLAVFTLAIAVFAGHPDWGPYIDYIKLYSRGFGALPVIFFGQGPLMGTLTILSAAALLWIVIERRITIPAETRVALAGFTGFALASYTYYLGRSADNNLVHLLPPVVAYLTVWTGVLLGTAERRSQLSRGVLATTAVLLLAATLTVGVAWREIRGGWGSTALAQVLPAGGGTRSLPDSLRFWWHDPVIDPRVPAGEALLARYWRPGEPAMIVASPDLTTELLIRTRRRNVLPLGHPSEDDLIASSAAKVQRVVDAVRPGTYVLVGANEASMVSTLQSIAFQALQGRFTVGVVAKRGDFMVVRLVDA
ncbi:MAG TPA: hypothetical protein VI318_05430 [Baekduia sp.]